MQSKSGKSRCNGRKRQLSFTKLLQRRHRIVRVGETERLRTEKIDPDASCEVSDVEFMRIPDSTRPQRGHENEKRDEQAGGAE